MSVEWQYTIIGLIIGGCLVWMLRGFIRLAHRKGKGGCSCPGCALSQTCNRKKR